jgi:hypothetical protein
MSKVYVMAANTAAQTSVREMYGSGAGRATQLLSSRRGALSRGRQSNAPGGAVGRRGQQRSGAFARRVSQ